MGRWGLHLIDPALVGYELFRDCYVSNIAVF